MPISISNPVKLKARLNAWAHEQGFSAIGVADAGSRPDLPSRLADWLDAGHHASMDWMAETAERRASPASLWPDVGSLILLGMNYGPDEDPLANLARAEIGNISVYARNRDYHDVIKGRLKTIAGKFAAASGAEVKVFVDTAPLMEKPFAQSAGLGWQGKHSNLVSREFGSWLFLGAILTTFRLPNDNPIEDHCGSCRACLDACPTDAFPSPYVVDARRCISYLTIEHHGMIDRTMRPRLGNRIYGCDDCLAACPWNKFAVQAQEMKLAARDDLRAPPLSTLLALDDAGFRAMFSGSPVKRIGRNRFIRNCLIAAGNAALPDLVPAVSRHLADPDPVVVASAIWALARLVSPAEFDALTADCPLGRDPLVVEEIAAARKGLSS